MNMLKLLTALCLIGSTCAIALAANETMELGPAMVSMDLQGMGPYQVAKDSPVSLNHNFGGYVFSYEVFSATIEFNNSTNQVLIGVHQMGASEPLTSSVPQLNTLTGLEHCVEASGMLPRSNEISKEQYAIDGQEGLLMTINRAQNGPVYIAAYSPDLKGGSGRTVVIIGSDFPWNSTKNIFESVKTQIGAGNITGNMSMTGMGQGNMTGQAGMATQSGITIQGNLIVQGNLVINMVVPGNAGMSQSGMTGMSSSNQGMMGMGDMMAMMQSCMAMMQSMMGPDKWSQGNTSSQSNMMAMSSMGMSNMGQNTMTGMSSMGENVSPVKATSAERNMTMEKLNMLSAEAKASSAQEGHGHHPA